ncbi:class I SAM-dependent methyltransferase [Mycolicibacterium moriokaense]|nr:class I SAM-dependent methyltransferase [Mycolicibacterium moriokaense]
MTSRRLLFRIFYRLGFTPWDGHPLATALTNLIEGDNAPPAGTALDIGCGTGDNAIYLAQHGWRVTGVDFVHKAVDKARAKAAAKDLDIRFEQADATRLGQDGIGSSFDLIVDNGCLHGMNDDDRSAYAREVTAAAAPGARLLLVEFVPGGSYGVPGIEPSEVAQRFEGEWTLLSSGDEPSIQRDGKESGRYYLFSRAS